MVFLPFVVIIMGLVVGLGFLNEKITGITHEIALMLFSGSCHMQLADFKEQARQVTVFSVLATFFGAVFYGVLFYGVSLLLGLSFTFPMCLLFGSIVAPTDPIAATSILKKFGLPKKTGFLIEGESLLNDGVGVALFVCFAGLVKAERGANFFEVMGRELFGAMAVGIVVSVVSFLVFYFPKTKSCRSFRVFSRWHALICSVNCLIFPERSRRSYAAFCIRT